MANLIEQFLELRRIKKDDSETSMSLNSDGTYCINLKVKNGFYKSYSVRQETVSRLIEDLQKMPDKEYGA